MIKYDTERKTVFGPSDLKLKGSPSKCLFIFDDEIWEDLILTNQNLETFPVTNAFGRQFDTYRYIDVNGEKILLVYPTMGAAGAVCDMELLIASGINKIVAFGTCGRLDKNIAQNTIILPTAAYREEGTSSTTYQKAMRLKLIAMPLKFAMIFLIKIVLQLSLEKSGQPMRYIVRLLEKLH